MGEAFETVRVRGCAGGVEETPGCRVVPLNLPQWRSRAGRGNPRLRQLRRRLGGHNGLSSDRWVYLTGKRRQEAAAIRADLAQVVVDELDEFVDEPVNGLEYGLASLVLDELAGVVTSVTEGGSFSYHPVARHRRR